MSEARKAPLAFLLPDGKLLDILDTPEYDHVTRAFLTPDRTRTLLFLRMRESGREEPRQAVVERLTADEFHHQDWLRARLQIEIHEAGEVRVLG